MARERLYMRLAARSGPGLQAAHPEMTRTYRQNLPITVQIVQAMRFTRSASPTNGAQARFSDALR